jgi:hypothetical protein
MAQAADRKHQRWRGRQHHQARAANICQQSNILLVHGASTSAGKGVNSAWCSCCSPCPGVPCSSCLGCVPHVGRLLCAKFVVADNVLCTGPVTCLNIVLASMLSDGASSRGAWPRAGLLSCVTPLARTAFVPAHAPCYVGRAQRAAAASQGTCMLAVKQPCAFAGQGVPQGKQNGAMAGLGS